MNDCKMDEMFSSAKRRKATKGLSSSGHCRELRGELLLLFGGVWLRLESLSPIIVADSSIARLR